MIQLPLKVINAKPASAANTRKQLLPAISEQEDDVDSASSQEKVAFASSKPARIGVISRQNVEITAPESESEPDSWSALTFDDHPSANEAYRNDDSSVIDFSPTIPDPEIDCYDSDQSEAPVQLKSNPVAKKPANSKVKSSKPAPSPTLQLSNRDFAMLTSTSIHFQVLDTPGSKDARSLNLTIPGGECGDLATLRKKWLDKMGIPRKSHEVAQIGYRFGGVWSGRVCGLDNQEDWEFALEVVGEDCKIKKKAEDAGKTSSRKSKQPVCIVLSNAVSHPMRLLLYDIY